jgi:microcystin-dependent protein
VGAHLVVRVVVSGAALEAPGSSAAETSVFNAFGTTYGLDAFTTFGLADSAFSSGDGAKGSGSKGVWGDSTQRGVVGTLGGTSCAGT